MKFPRKPPIINEIGVELERFPLILTLAKRSESEGKYRHWDIVRHLKPPGDLSSEEWWLGIKWVRKAQMESIPLFDNEGESFSYMVPDGIAELLHQLDLLTGGGKGVPDVVRNPHTQNEYLVRSLMEESITSSQLEGAATTREVAKEMLRLGRPPRDENEQMILNNFATMQQIREWKNLPLTEDLVFEIHRQITEGTLDSADGAGRFRTDRETVVVEDTQTQEILHVPPPASELPMRLKALCDFANGKTPNDFVHPVIRAVILHFWLAYDHPFVDGNGRCARALFYWLMLREDYWIFEYLSISDVILKAPVKYGKAFLHTETDDNDLTYFIIHQCAVIKRALERLHERVIQQANERREFEDLTKLSLNHRQEALLIHALGHPRTYYTIEGHRTSHKIAYETARHDLQDLQARELLLVSKKGKGFVYTIPKDLRSHIESLS